MLELRIMSPSPEGFVKAIEWNHEEIKAEVAAKVGYYKNLVYTDDQIKEAKTDRATLKKFVAALEDKRKEIKKQCLAPYESFEKQMKEITAIVNEPIGLIDKQVKEFEEKRREEKCEKIREVFESMNFWPFVGFDKIFRPEWLNSSVSMKRIEEELKAEHERIDRDVTSLNQIPEFSFEAAEVYKKTLDLNLALARGRELSDIAKRKAEFEAEQERARAEVASRPELSSDTVEPAISPKEVVSHPEEAASIVRRPVSFRCWLTIEDATALKEFFQARNIEYEAI